MSEIFRLIANSDDFGESFYDIVDKIFTEGILKVEYGDDFGVDLILERVREDDSNTVGYKVDFSALHNTVIDIDDDKYNTFVNSFESEEYTSIFDECYEIDEVVTRFTIGTSLELEANFLKHILDWSTLFDDQELPTIFQMRILEAMEGILTLNLQVDIDLEGGIGALDLIAEIINEDGDNILNVYYDCGYITRGEINPNIYIESSTLGIPKILLDFSECANFLGVDEELIRNIFVKTDQVAESLNMPRAIAQNEDIIAEDEETGPQIAGIRLGNLFESISIGKGTLALVAMPSAIASIIYDIFGFPFDEVGDISLELDNLNNTLKLNIPIDVAINDEETGEPLVPSKLNLGMGIKNVNARLGPNNNFFEDVDFSDFEPISQYAWATEINSSLKINDDLCALFDLSDITMPIMGMQMQLQSAEKLDVEIDFKLSTYVSFSNLSDMRLQLEISQNGERRIMIAYVGSESEGEIYVDLNGIALPAMKTTAINFGEIIENLI